MSGSDFCKLASDPMGYQQFLDMNRVMVRSAMAFRLADYARCNTLTDVEAQFIDFALRNRNRSDSQYFQDLFVAFCLGERRTGFFIEFGGADGLTHSNSLMLETEYGWRGILLEPNPFEYGLLKRNRPDAVTLEVAVKCGDADTVELVICGQLSSISGFEDHDGHGHIRKLSTVNTLGSMRRIGRSHSLCLLRIDHSTICQSTRKAVRFQYCRDSPLTAGLSC